MLLAISLFGWIAVTANMFGHSVHDLLAQHGVDIPTPLLVAIGCVIFVASTAFGFAILGKVAQFAVPVIALMLCYIVYRATEAELRPQWSSRPCHRGLLCLRWSAPSSYWWPRCPTSVALCMTANMH